LKKPGNIRKVLQGGKVGTIVRGKNKR